MFQHIRKTFAQRNFACSGGGAVGPTTNPPLAIDSSNSIICYSKPLPENPTQNSVQLINHIFRWANGTVPASEWGAPMCIAWLFNVTEVSTQRIAIAYRSVESNKNPFQCILSLKNLINFHFVFFGSSVWQIIVQNENTCNSIGFDWNQSWRAIQSGISKLPENIPAAAHRTVDIPSADTCLSPLGSQSIQIALKS